MRKPSNSKKWMVDVEAWGGTCAPTVGKAVEWVRVQAEVEAVALALVRARERAKATAAEAEVEVEVEAGAGLRPIKWTEALVKAGLRPIKWTEALVKAAKASARAWAPELAEVHKALGAWKRALGQAQVQAWLRLCVSEVEVEWPRRRQDYWWLIQIITPIARLPPELLHQILLIVIDNVFDSPLVLMRVCKYWYNTVTRIWASLKLGTTTSEYTINIKLERSQSLLDVLVDTDADRGHFTPWNRAYQGIFIAMQATSRWRTLVVKTFPAQAALPKDLINLGLQKCSDLVMSRLRTLTIECPCEMSPLLERLLFIIGNTASEELTTVTINSAIVISFLVPTYSSIFRSVTVLSLDPQGLRNPVDLLPHLHKLESLTASHLPLPAYPDDVDLPFVHTLRHLTLRSVSIQWMSGRTFHVLESCTLLFPLHRHILHMFRTSLPNCKHLSFEGYPLNILSGVSAHKLTHLSVKSSSYKPRGNRQLALFSSQALQEGRLAPHVLHISIEAMNEAWRKAFASMSNLQELVIDNARPSSLGVKALRSLVVLPMHANNVGATATLGGWNAPACPSLRRFGLRYRRWLRPSEQFDLIPVFMSIIKSRQQSKFTLQSFRIWTGSDNNDPLELMDGSQISLNGFECLGNITAIKGWD